MLKVMGTQNIKCLLFEDHEAEEETKGCSSGYVQVTEDCPRNSLDFVLGRYLPKRMCQYGFGSNTSRWTFGN